METTTHRQEVLTPAGFSQPELTDPSIFLLTTLISSYGKTLPHGAKMWDHDVIPQFVGHLVLSRSIKDAAPTNRPVARRV
jgi:hypothetical protein